MDPVLTAVSNDPEEESLDFVNIAAGRRLHRAEATT